MNKFAKGFVMLLTAASILLPTLSFAGCGGEKKADPSDIKVWTASSDLKYRQDDVAAATEERELELTVVRNEYESAQIMLTAAADIDRYGIRTADLRSGDDVLGAENFDVYMEKYVRLRSGGDTTVYGAGWYPDALIPVDLAEEAGEMTVAAGNNAGLWVTLYVPKETPAGTYTGTFTVTADGLEIPVPVTVKVADYTLTDEHNALTSFTWRYNRVGSGEFDWTTEMMETYYDYFLDYRITLQNPVVDVNTPEQFADAVEKNFEEMSCYTLMPYIGELGGAEARWDNCEAQILELAARSAPERNLLEKAMLYFIDEPVLSEANLPNFTARLKAHNEKIAATADKIAADTSGKYDAFKEIEGWRSYVEDMPNIIPVNLAPLSGNMESEPVKSFLNEVNCLCPIWYNYSDPDLMEIIDTLQTEYDVTIWWYGCINPTAPYANYHIGDVNLLGTRTITWLQYMYGWEGNLYWDAAAYTSYAGETYGQPVDVYESPYRAVGVMTDLAGDGFLTYPGAKYGHYGPLPSMRLMSIRDGNEDYELLLDLENKYESVAAGYGTTADKMMERLYDGLYYNGSMMYADGENYLDFRKLRAELIDLLDTFDGEEAFRITDVQTSDNHATVEFRANASEYRVLLGSLELTPESGDLFRVRLPLSGDGFYRFRFIDKTTGEETSATRFIGTPVDYLMELDEMREVPEEIRVPDNSSVFVNDDPRYRTSGHSIGLEIACNITGNSLQDLLNRPEFSIGTDLFDVGMDEIVYLHLDLYSAGTESESLTVLLASGSSTQQIATLSLSPGKNGVELAMKGFVFSKLAETDRIIFRFDNKGTVENPYVYRLYIDNVYAVKEGN